MNKISFNILPSPVSNDHEVRILFDNKDLLGSDYLGLDPPAFFSQENFDKNGALMIGRCICGCEGCFDYLITVIANENTIFWKNKDGLNLVFDKQDYNRSIGAAKDDYSWEDIKRKVERLTTNMLKYSQTKDNYNFSWASARIKDNQIILSYRKDGDQKLFYIAWDGQTETNVEHNAEQFLKGKLQRE